MKRCPRCNETYDDHVQFCTQDGASLVDTPVRDPVLGMLIAGTYRVRARLDAGGFGAVYKATHVRLPMTVAVKVLNSARAMEPEMVSRFRLEAEAEAMLTHPNIVRVLDHGHDPKAGYYIAMEFLVGQDLAKRLDNGPPLGVLELEAVLDQTIAALDAVHRFGFVHRDVKPENLFLVDDPTRPEKFHVKLLDFGLTRVRQELSLGVAHEPQRHLTRASRTLGSVGTMAPEVAAHADIDARADIYSLGAVLFEMLTSEILFDAIPAVERIAHICRTPAPAPSTRPKGGWVPAEMDAFVLRLLAKNPAARPQTMAEVRSELERVLPVTRAAWASAFLRPTVQETATSAPSVDLPSLKRQAPQADAQPVVLVVDDDRSMRMILQTLIRAQGCICDTCDGADAAFAWLQQHPSPEAIVTDLLMPVMGGVEFGRVLRQRGYDGALIVCTAMDSDTLGRDAALANSAWHLDKTRELNKLQEILRAAGVCK